LGRSRADKGMARRRGGLCPSERDGCWPKSSVQCAYRTKQIDQFIPKISPGREAITLEVKLYCGTIQIEIPRRSMSLSLVLVWLSYPRFSMIAQRSTVTSPLNNSSMFQRHEFLYDLIRKPMAASELFAFCACCVLTPSSKSLSICQQTDRSLFRSIHEHLTSTEIS
jgi:hypothetical protein